MSLVLEVVEIVVIVVMGDVLAVVAVAYTSSPEKDVPGCLLRHMLQAKTV